MPLLARSGAAVFFTLVSGCFNPNPPELACSSGFACPPGQSCEADGKCRPDSFAIDDGAEPLGSDISRYAIAPLGSEDAFVAVGRRTGPVLQFFRIDDNGVDESIDNQTGVEFGGDLDSIYVHPLIDGEGTEQVLVFSEAEDADGRDGLFLTRLHTDGSLIAPDTAYSRLAEPAEGTDILSYTGESALRVVDDGTAQLGVIWIDADTSILHYAVYNIFSAGDAQISLGGDFAAIPVAGQESEIAAFDDGFAIAWNGDDGKTYVEIKAETCASPTRHVLDQTLDAVQLVAGDGSNVIMTATDRGDTTQDVLRIYTISCDEVVRSPTPLGTHARQTSAKAVAAAVTDSGELGTAWALARENGIGDVYLGRQQPVAGGFEIDAEPERLTTSAGHDADRNNSQRIAWKRGLGYLVAWKDEGVSGYEVLFKVVSD